MSEMPLGPSRTPTAARFNLLATYLGRLSSGALSLLFIPIYVKFMGIEAFGLVGFYTSLIGVLAIFDLGMNATITRELASADADPLRARRASDLVSTLGALYWLIAALIVGVVAINAHWLASNWLHASALSNVTLGHAIILMGGTIAGQMLLGFYCAALYGLQRHVACNIANFIIAIVRSGGSVLVLWLVSPSITAFFAWQLVSVFAGLVAIATVLRWYMPKAQGAVRPALLREVWRFAAGAFAASVSGMLVYQIDKVVLSTMLSLRQFGYYTLAVTAASALQYLSDPVFTTFYPSFSRKVAMHDQRALTEQYHRVSQILAVAAIPAAAMLVFFSRTLIFVWTGNADLAANTGPLLTLLGLGMTFHAMTPLTFGMQLAHGWTKLSVVANFALFLFLIPALLTVVPLYGAIGAAIAWTTAKAIYLIGTVWVMHRRIMIGEQRRWYLYDLLPSTAVVVIAAYVASLYDPVWDLRLWGLVRIGFIYGTLLVAATLATPETRQYALRFVRKVRMGAARRVGM